MSTKNRLSKRISAVEWAAGKREKIMTKAITKSTMQDGTPEDVTKAKQGPQIHPQTTPGLPRLSHDDESAGAEPDPGPTSASTGLNPSG
jgi:hypothetical protein